MRPPVLPEDTRRVVERRPPPGDTMDEDVETAGGNGWLIVRDPTRADRWIATDSPVEIVD